MKRLCLFGLMVFGSDSRDLIACPCAGMSWLPQGRGLIDSFPQPETRIIFAYWTVSPVRIRPMAPGTRFLNRTCGS